MNINEKLVSNLIKENKNVINQLHKKLEIDNDGHIRPKGLKMEFYEDETDADGFWDLAGEIAFTCLGNSNYTLENKLQEKLYNVIKYGVS
jgi:hypothetical protein